MNRAVVAIPRGFESNGSWTKKATIRELTGYDEEAIAETLGAPRPGRATALLGRVVSFAGTPAKAVPDVVKRLAVGDRAALALGVRVILFGDRMDCVVTCPSCGNDMSVELSASQLSRHGRAQPAKECELEVDGRRLRLRPVSGSDLESACERGDDESREEELVRSCVAFSDPPLPEGLPERLVSAISERLADMDPMADLQLDLACPGCGNRFQTPFFAEAFLLQEIGYLLPQLEKEVHWMAFNYKWSEREILSLPVSKRRRYLELIDRTLSGEGV